MTCIVLGGVLNSTLSLTSASEMTYIVSSGALNSTQSVSLTCQRLFLSIIVNDLCAGDWVVRYIYSRWDEGEFWSVRFAGFSFFVWHGSLAFTLMF